jgi:hypothetical protein
MRASQQPTSSVLQRVPHALHASARRQHALAGILVLALPHFRHRIDKPRNEPNKDSTAAGQSGGSVEEDESGKGNGQLVESAYHRVGGGGGDAHAPGRAVGDEDRGQAREDHDGEDFALGAGGEVDGDVGRGPVFHEEGANEEDGDGEQVVVVHGCGRGRVSWECIVMKMTCEHSLSKSLKLVSLMRLRMPSTYAAEQKQLINIQT